MCLLKEKVDKKMKEWQKQTAVLEGTIQHHSQDVRQNFFCNSKFIRDFLLIVKNSVGRSL
jgi:hypothetical protein